MIDPAGQADVIERIGAAAGTTTSGFARKSAPNPGGPSVLLQIVFAQYDQNKYPGGLERLIAAARSRSGSRKSGSDAAAKSRLSSKSY